MTKEEILAQYTMSPSRVMQQDYRADTVIEAMQEYADQCLSEQSATIENLASKVVDLQAELTRLKEENSMLLERINENHIPLHPNAYYNDFDPKYKELHKAIDDIVTKVGYKDFVFAVLKYQVHTLSQYQLQKTWK